MRPPGTSQQLERRRRRALQLLRSGKPLSAVARLIGAAKSSVSRWSQAYQQGGWRTLRPRPIPGRPCRLSEPQKAALARMLLQGPLAYGYPTDLWTLKRIAQLIGQRFRIRYHPNHVWRLLVSMGWSCQRPQTRARERNEAAIRYWKQHLWPHIKKRRKAWSPSGLPR